MLHDRRSGIRRPARDADGRPSTPPVPRCAAVRRKRRLDQPARRSAARRGSARPRLRRPGAAALDTTAHIAGDGRRRPCSPASVGHGTRRHAGGPIDDPGFEARFRAWMEAERSTRTFFVVDVDGTAVGMANVKQLRPDAGGRAGRRRSLGLRRERVRARLAPQPGPRCRSSWTPSSSGRANAGSCTSASPRHPCRSRSTSGSASCRARSSSSTHRAP